MGEPLPIDEGGDYIFGVVLLNDGLARLFRRGKRSARHVQCEIFWFDDTHVGRVNGGLPAVQSTKHRKRNRCAAVSPGETQE
jgi:hypothetical protein